LIFELSVVFFSFVSPLYDPVGNLPKDEPRHGVVDEEILVVIPQPIQGSSKSALSLQNLSNSLFISLSF